MAVSVSKQSMMYALLKPCLRFPSAMDLGIEDFLWISYVSRMACIVMSFFNMAMISFRSYKRFLFPLRVVQDGKKH
ncbi:hypothetical protein VNO78_21203 [Psophocarpus tetragonolobus]|uniref:Uncharacterized protein n=1 Tax=Psophocarpus tetragonolobus TaxID=3891 RepID=A0AAN9SBB3_PSOTE